MRKLNQKILRGIESYNPKVIVFDIDGTLKDLCKEHSEALLITMKQCGVGDFRKSLVKTLNKMAMFMVKTGLFSTNHCKQNILIRIFALLSGVNGKVFASLYFENYAKELYLFDGASELLSSLNSEKIVYFATINKQNYNLGACGIPQERIVYTEGAFKKETYSKLLQSLGVEKHEVLVVGDNVFDDLLSAKRLKVECLLINHYNSRIKNVICKLVNGKYLK